MDPGHLQRLLAEALARVGADVAVSVSPVEEVPNRFLAMIDTLRTEVAWLPQGWPRDIRRLLDEAHSPDVVASKELSEGSRALLTENKISWLDQTGAMRLMLPGLYIHTEGKPSPKPKADASWTPSTLAVCEALLIGVGGTVAEIRRETGLSPSTVATSLRLLQSEHLLDAAAARGRNARRRVVDEETLLDAYARASALLRSADAIRVGVLWRNPERGVEDFGVRLESMNVAWSVTGALAADMLAPYLTEVDPWEVYVDSRSAIELRQIAREAGVEESRGGRLVLKPFPTPAKDALSMRRGSVRIAPWPRVWADLREIGVRGDEAAEHLRERMGADA